MDTIFFILTLKLGSIEIDLKFLTSFLSPDLNKHVALAIENCHEILPYHKLSLQFFVISKHKRNKYSLNTSKGISSEPELVFHIEDHKT